METNILAKLIRQHLAVGTSVKIHLEMGAFNLHAVKIFVAL